MNISLPGIYSKAAWIQSWAAALCGPVSLVGLASKGPLQPQPFSDFVKKPMCLSDYTFAHHTRVLMRQKALHSVSKGDQADSPDTTFLMAQLAGAESKGLLQLLSKSVQLQISNTQPKGMGDEGGWFSPTANQQEPGRAMLRLSGWCKCRRQS